MKKQTTRIRKNYRIEIPANPPVIIRQTSTIQHSLKHAAYASQLRIRVRVVDSRTEVVIIELPPIDKAHREPVRKKRDREYLRAFKTAKKRSQIP